MEIFDRIGQTIALYYETNTELALWATIAIIAAVLLLIMLISPAFRRFMAIVIVISVVIGALLINFGNEVARGL